jgi:trehalose-6-phosphate synthase
MISEVRKGLREACKMAPKILAKWPEWKIKVVTRQTTTPCKP